MKPDGNRERDFENNLTQILQLLRKMLGSQLKSGGLPDLFSSQPKNQGFNVTVNFFSFFPMTLEELDELEALYEEMESADDEEDEIELTNELTRSDMDFLRQHGIKF